MLRDMGALSPSGEPLAIRKHREGQRKQFQNASSLRSQSVMHTKRGFLNRSVDNEEKAS
jgi:hypothetical protein